MPVSDGIVVKVRSRSINTNTFVWYDITERVLKDGFPSGFKESLKGDGYFQYQVQPFTFTILTPMVYNEDTYASSVKPPPKPSRYDQIEFFQERDNEKIFSGFIDELSNQDDDETWSINATPSAVILKDHLLGTDTGDDEDEVNSLFTISEQTHVRDIAQQIIEEVNSDNEAGIQFTLNSTTIPDGEPPLNNPFVGSLAKVKKMSGFSWLLGKLVHMWTFPYSMLSETGDFPLKYSFRKTASDLFYLVKRKGRFAFPVFISLGHWLHITAGQWFSVASGYFLSIDFRFGFDLGYLGSYFWDFGSWKIPRSGGWHIPPEINVPPNDIRLPTFSARYTIYQALTGSLDVMEEMEWSPLFPFLQNAPSLSTNYGSTYTATSQANISNAKVRAFLKSKGYDTDREILQIVNVNDRNTYVLATAKKGRWDFSGSYIVLVFETAFDEYYRCTFMNTNPMDVFTDMSKLTNRYFYVDHDNQVWMLPRGTLTAQSIGDANMDLNNLIKKKIKVHREADVDVDINRQEEMDGEIMSYGFVIRNEEYEAIKSHYKKQFRNPRTEYTMNFISPPNDVGLLKRLVVNDGVDFVDYGNIINIDDSFLEPMIKVTTEKYDV